MLKPDDVTEAEKNAIATETAAIMEAKPEIEPFDAILRACRIFAERGKQARVRIAEIDAETRRVCARTP